MKLVNFIVSLIIVIVLFTFVSAQNPLAAVNDLIDGNGGRKRKKHEFGFGHHVWCKLT